MKIDNKAFGAVDITKYLYTSPLLASTHSYIQLSSVGIASQNQCLSPLVFTYKIKILYASWHSLGISLGLHRPREIVALGGLGTSFPLLLEWGTVPDKKSIVYEDFYQIFGSKILLQKVRPKNLIQLDKIFMNWQIQNASFNC